MNHTADVPGTGPHPVSSARPPELLELPGGASLRRRRVAHAAALNEAVRTNLEHLRPWMPWAKAEPSMEHSIEMSRAGEEVWDAGTDFMYVLTAADGTDAVIGAFGLHGRIGPGALEIGYWVAEAHNGRGLATEGARALTAAALGLPGVDRVEIHCDEANPASASVPRKLGYRLDRIDVAPITAPSETGRKMVWITTG
jgi:RimJ/RimL family protein N-acetyltransferase